MRVMPGATSRAPSARPDGSVQPAAPGLARARSLAARVWSDHRLFILVLAPAVLLRVDAELGYRWQSWFNDSFEYLANTISFSLDPTRVSGYSVWLRILEPFHSYALITILQHLEGLSVGVMVYALARHRFGAKAWIATLAAVPVLYDGFEIQLEHLILSDVPFLFLVMLATTLLLWNPAGPSTRDVRGHRPAPRPGRGAALDRAAAGGRVRRVHDHQAGQLAEGGRRHRGVRYPGLRVRRGVLPAARAVRDERRHRRVPVLAGDVVRQLLGHPPARRRARAVRPHQPPGLAGNRAELHLDPAHPAGRVPAAEVHLRAQPVRGELRDPRHRGAAARLPRGGRPRHRDGVRLEADRVPAGGDLRRVPVRHVARCRSRTGIASTSGNTTPTRPSTCGATR